MLSSIWSELRTVSVVIHPTVRASIQAQGLNHVAKACDIIGGAYVMKVLAIAILVIASIGTTALAQQQQQQQQQRSARDMMNDMKARYGQTFDQCRDLAVSRGYRLDEETVDRAIMMFVEGCILGKQR